MVGVEGLVGFVGVWNLCRSKNLGDIHEDSMAFGDRQLYFVFLWFYCTPLNRGAGAISCALFG